MRFRVIAAMCWICIMLGLCSMKIEGKENSGSIEIKMQKNGNAIHGGSVTLYCVARWDGEKYRTKASFDNLVSLELDWSQTEMAHMLSDHTSKRDLDGITHEIDENGFASFLNLENGIYLIVQKDPAEGFLSFCPFLVSIPSYAEGDEIYHISAYPKCEESAQGQSPQTGDICPPIALFALSGFGTVWMMRNLLKQKKLYV